MATFAPVLSASDSPLIDENPKPLVPQLMNLTEIKFQI